MQIDTSGMHETVRNFQFRAAPSDACGSNPAKIEDIRRVINETAKALNAIISEIEKQND